MIVPFPAGGITDIVARLVGGSDEDYARPAGDRGEHPAVPGGTIGVTRLARSAPDGYTHRDRAVDVHVGAAVMYQVPFDYRNDFEPISMPVGRAALDHRPQGLPGQQCEGADRLVEGQSEQGDGAAPSASAAAFTCASSISPRRPARPCNTCRVAARRRRCRICSQARSICPARGRPDAGAIPRRHHQGVRRAFTEKRWFAAPDVQTIQEAGVPRGAVPFWHGLFAPKGVPKDVMTKIHAALSRCAGRSRGAASLTELGHEVAPLNQQNAEAMGAYYKETELDKWTPIIKAANIKLR